MDRFKKKLSHVGRSFKQRFSRKASDSDGGDGSRVALALESGVEVPAEQGHERKVLISSPTPADTPTARPGNAVPFTSRLGRSSSDGDAASDGGALLLGPSTGNGRSIAGEAEISPPQALEGAVRGPHDNHNDAAAHVVGTTSEDCPIDAKKIPEPREPAELMLPAPTLEDAIHGAHDKRDDAVTIGTRASNAVQLTQDGAVAAEYWAERVDNLFKQLSAFCNILGNVGEIHPYVRLVTGFVNTGIQPVLKQKVRDDAMKKLIEDMDDAFDKVMADEHVKGRKVREGDPRCKLFAKLAKQTVDCAWFIREYYETKSFMKRALKGIVDYNVDEKISQYSAAFVELGEKIANCDLSDTVKFVTTISITVVQIDATLTLQRLHVPEGTGRQRDKTCMKGTRTGTLNALVDWINDPAATRAQFVTGVAGVGKSSIAHSIAFRMEAVGRLGAFFAFDRSDPSLHPWTAFIALARALANWNSDFKHELCQVLHEKGHLSTSRDVIELWEELIVRPAQKVICVGPVLVVIEAFDECTDLKGPATAFDRKEQSLERGRKNLLQCLTQRVGELPANFRVLVTSRLEDDVIVMSDNVRHGPAASAVVFWDLDQASVEANESIELYIRHQLDGSLGDQQIGALVKAADTLFEWAAATCRYLLDPFTGGSSIHERYSAWFEGPAGIVHEASRSLERLYHTILGQRFTGPVGLKRFREVMAQVLFAAEPVSWDTLVALRRTGDVGDKAVNLVIPHLGSLLSGVGEHSVPIRPLHTSFRDFLTRADVAHSWHVQPGDVHDVIALGALRVLNNSLHFDIWDFPSSYVSNNMIDDLYDRMKNFLLPAGLVYASRHWSYHLSMVSKSDVSLQTELRIFLTQKLLFWLEVVSLCNFMNSAVSFLLTAASFFKPLHDDDVVAFINDATLFVCNLIQPMDYLSVPHIYLSALAFCPTTSLVRRLFVRNSNLLPTIDGLAAEWPAVLCPHRVRCFAYSPDGIYMALVCWDGVVRLVEAENMHNLVRELTCTPGSPNLWVGSVTFSPNGQIIAADAHTDDIVVILRWNAETGEMLGISHGHTNRIQSLCFSPDGRYMVSASWDRTIRRWDAKTGQQIGDSLQGHTSWVHSVVCSLLSDSIISAGDDATMRIWNADTGQQDGPPIPTPGQRPLHITLARSPKGNLIAVGMVSEDSSSVWVFDFDQRCFVRELSRQHQNCLLSIAWSYDGRCIASAFRDGNILLWDYFDSSSIALRIRTTSFDAIDFSPDGNHLLLTHSGGNLSTVDVATTQSHPPEYQAGPAEYAAYSPDGRFSAVAFGGEDVPYVWDAETGASISDDRVLTASLTWLKPAIDGSLHLQHYDWDNWNDRKERRPHEIVSANGLRSAGIWSGEISIWDSASHTLLRPSIRIPSGWVTCVALSPSGDCVLQGSSDGTVRIFHVDQSADNTPLPAKDSASGTRRSHSPEGEHGVPVLRPDILGWLHDNDGLQIIYVPEQYRADLPLPGLVHILRPNREPATPVKIDFSGVGFGTEWTRCGGALSVDLGNAPVPSEPVAND